jgi:predicted transcriptional regulator
MNSLTIKLDAGQAAWLSQQASRLRRSRGAIIRALLDEQAARAGDSLHARMKDLCGVLDGPQNLSVRKLSPRYGRN